MLTIYSRGADAPQVWRPGSAAMSAPMWLDLVYPSQDERDHAQLLLGYELPTREQTSAIELSSRLRSFDKALCLNIPAFVRAEGDHGPLTPLGFVLTPTVLASVRYADSLAFRQVADTFANTGAAHSGVDVFGALIESIIDVAADRLEAVATELSELTHEVFQPDRSRPRWLRRALFKIGAMQRQITQLRSAMLGVSRLVGYLHEESPPWIDAKVHVQFKIAQTDIGSLNEFDQQLSDRLQFLLDAVLGFINNEQNDIMRVLTIVSVATVPAMILAGIWGMNFKSIPEYDWPHGYAFGLSMILLSMVLPLVWFKLKKWL